MIPQPHINVCVNMRFKDQLCLVRIKEFSVSYLVETYVYLVETFREPP